MKWKERLLVEVSKNDPFNLLVKLKNREQVLSAHLVNFNSILVYYDNRKISKEEILKITSGKLLEAA